MYQALQTVMQVSSWARVRCLKTDTQTSFSPPFSLPTSLKEGRDSRVGGDNVRAGPVAAPSSSDEEPEEAKRPLTPRRRGLGEMWCVKSSKTMRPSFEVSRASVLAQCDKHKVNLCSDSLMCKYTCTLVLSFWKKSIWIFFLLKRRAKALVTTCRALCVTHPPT